MIDEKESGAAMVAPKVAAKLAEMDAELAAAVAKARAELDAAAAAEDEDAAHRDLFARWDAEDARVNLELAQLRVDVEEAQREKRKAPRRAVPADPDLLAPGNATSDMAALLADPARAGGVTDAATLRRLSDEVDARREQLETARRALHRQSLALLSETPAPVPAADSDVIPLAEAVRITGCSEDYLRHNWRRLGLASQ